MYTPIFRFIIKRMISVQKELIHAGLITLDLNISVLSIKAVNQTVSVENNFNNRVMSNNKNNIVTLYV